jgi:hypothetical protein
MLVSAIDFGLLLAVLTMGWGIVTATYRPVAEAVHWPMGAPQRRHPHLARNLGMACVICAVAFVVWRVVAGYPLSAAMILIFGLAWAAFWLGFLRVGAQSALLLAPMSAALLLWRWLAWVPGAGA